MTEREGPRQRLTSLASLLWPRRVRDRRRARYAVSQVLADASTHDDAAPRILTAIGENLGWALGAFWVVDEHEDVLKCTALWRQPGVTAAQFEAATRDMTFRRGVGLPGRIWARGAPAWITDVRRDPNFPRARMAAQAGLHGACGFPIMHGGKILGAIEFFNQRALRPDEDLLEMLATIGHQIGQFLERARAERGGRESEARTVAVLLAALDAIMTIDHQGHVLEFNPAAERLFGYSRAEALGREMADLIIPPALRERHRAGLARYLATGEARVLGRRVEMPAIRADGTEFPVELTITRIEVSGPPQFTGHIRDLTERKRAETAERHAREAAERAADRTNRLQAVTAGLSEALTPAQVADVILDQGTRALGAEAGAVYLLTKDGATLELIRSAGYPDALARRRSHLPIGAGAPSTESARTGHAIYLESRDAVLGRYPGLQEELHDHEGARVFLPLVAGGRAIGTLVFVFRDRKEFRDDDRSFIHALSQQCAQAMERAQLYAREHRVAEALQRAFLPADLPRFPGIAIHATYLPGTMEAEVGGDWYDVFRLPNGQIALSVGDVVGRGLEAAVVMGQLRQAIRAVAFDGHDPVTVLDRASTVLRLTSDANGMATAVFGVLDPVSFIFSYALAAHPAPALATADRNVELIGGRGGLPLGAAPSDARAFHTLALPAGSLLVLYTDGLIESTRNLRAGEAALAEALRAELNAPSPDPARGIADRVLGGHRPPDDVAILTVSVEAAPPDRVDLVLPAEPASARELRQVIHRLAIAHGFDADRVFALEAAVGEAVNNVIEHAYGVTPGPIRLRARRVGNAFIVEIEDDGRWRETRSEGGGHGLQLMQTLVDRLEIEHKAQGTLVRLELSRRGVDRPVPAGTAAAAPPPQTAGSDMTDRGSVEAAGPFPIRSVVGVPIIDVIGDVDFNNTRALQAAVERAVRIFRISRRAVILSMTHTTYLDSHGVELLVSLARRFRTNRLRLCVVVPPDRPIRTIFEVADLGSVLAVFDSLDAALTDAARDGRDSEEGVT